MSRIVWDGNAFTVHSVLSEKPLRIHPAAASSSGHSESAQPDASETDGLPGVAELVWLHTYSIGRRADGAPTPRRNLLFLDAEGFVILTVSMFNVSWESTLELAEAAAVPCAAYVIRNRRDNAEKIQNLMFPRRRHSQVV